MINFLGKFLNLILQTILLEHWAKAHNHITHINPELKHGVIFVVLNNRGGIAATAVKLKLKFMV